MTTAPAPEEPGVRAPLLDTVAALAARLRRRRSVHWAGRNRGWELAVFVGIAVLVILAILACLTVDPLSVQWARELPPGVAGFFRGMTRFGKSDWYLIPTGLFVLVLLATDWRRARPLIRFAWAEIGALVGYFFFAVAFAGILTDLIKWTIGRSRPVLFVHDGVLAFHPVSFGFAHTSFPSGHATTVAAATVAIGLISPRWAVPMAILAGIVAVSRVTVGAHYPSDVVGGLFVGAAYALGLAFWLARKGVAFRFDGRGRHKARLAAARRILARPGGAGAMLAALAAAIGAALTPPRRRLP